MKHIGLAGETWHRITSTRSSTRWPTFVAWRGIQARPTQPDFRNALQDRKRFWRLPCSKSAVVKGKWMDNWRQAVSTPPRGPGWAGLPPQLPLS